MPNQTAEQVNVLLVEDDDEDYLLTADLLSKLEIRYKLRRVADYQSALEAARSEDHDVCLVDYRLGPDDGIDLVRELIAADARMPMIVLTGQGDHDVDVEAAEAGAADYLVKSELTPTMLERTIRYAIRSYSDMQELREREEGLRQAQRLEAVGQLAGGVAHDFNNMMTAVIGFAELGLMRIDPQQDPLHRYLEEIKRAGERAGDLAQQLLAFSRKQVLQTRVFNLNELVTEVEHFLKRLLPDDVALVTILDPDVEPIEADSGQIEQVIMNLAINAGDAMPNGGKLTVETSNVDLDDGHASRYLDVRPGPYVVLMVSDSGVGMDAATVARVFEPFFTTKELGSGTGLGLSTVFGIITQSGGDVGIYSEPGKGTTFKVYLPRTRSPVAQPTAPPLAEAPSRGSETILLVDDEELVRSFERAALEKSGYRVLEAHGPMHALELAETHNEEIHLLVTDVVMPDLSGRELAEQLARERPRMKTLYTSGYASGAIARHGILEPGVSYLQKPLNVLTLTSKIRQVLDTP